MSQRPVGQFPFPGALRAVAPIVSSEYLDEARRDAEREAAQVMDRLAITPGTRVADIGAGHGYYAVRLAWRLGPTATIYAEDVQPNYLEDLRNCLKREGIGTVTLILGTAGDPKLPVDGIDVAIMAHHMYHEIENPFELPYRLRPALARNARIGIVETTRPTEAHGTPPALLTCEVSAVGYREIDILWLVSAERYLAVFTPPDRLPRPESIIPCKP